jgi:hypothetical protein
MKLFLLVSLWVFIYTIAGILSYFQRFPIRINFLPTWVQGIIYGMWPITFPIALGYFYIEIKKLKKLWGEEYNPLTPIRVFGMYADIFLAYFFVSVLMVLIAFN